MLTDEKKLFIRLYRCSNLLSLTSMDEIMALIYHNWIWLSKPLLCPDIVLFQQSEHVRAIMSKIFFIIQNKAT